MRRPIAGKLDTWCYFEPLRVGIGKFQGGPSDGSVMGRLMVSSWLSSRHEARPRRSWFASADAGIQVMQSWARSEQYWMRLSSDRRNASAYVRDNV